MVDRSISGHPVRRIDRSGRRVGGPPAPVGRDHAPAGCARPPPRSRGGARGSSPGRRWRWCRWSGSSACSSSSAPCRTGSSGSPRCKEENRRAREWRASSRLLDAVSRGRPRRVSPWRRRHAGQGGVFFFLRAVEAGGARGQLVLLDLRGRRLHLEAGVVNVPLERSDDMRGGRWQERRRGVGLSDSTRRS